MASGERLQLPAGLRCLVKEYGEHQEDAIERCVVLEEQMPPLLSELREGDIVVAVRAAEVVWTDTIMATGQYQHQPRLPYTPAGSYAGVVAWASPLAAKRTGVQPGQRVLIAGNAGPRSSGPHQKWGGCASYAVAPYTAIRRVPDTWTFEEAACMSYGYDTVHYVLVEAGLLQAGETILIQGATGGVGIPAIRMAKMLGAVVIAVSRSADKADFLKSIGADHVLAVGDGKGGVRRFSDDVKAHTDGRGVDVVYDGVGSDAITVESMRSCRFGARLLIVGWAATPNVAKGRGQRGAPNANRIPTNLIMMKGLHIIGCPAVISTGFNKSIVPRRMKDLHDWTSSGRLPPPTVGSRYPLSEIKAALRERMQSGQVVGSTVVLPPALDTSKL